MISSVFSKLLAILVITFGSLIFGIIPHILGLGSRYKNSVILSSVLCFGGGVLIATSVVHILREVRRDIPLYSEFIFCAGFYLIYLLDIILIIFKCNSSHENVEGDSLTGSRRYSNYGTVDVHIQAREDVEVRVPVQPSCKNFGLLAGFSVHSFLEGLVVGVQDTASGVLLLLVAVSCHKLLVAFCLGAELSADGKSVYSLIWPLIVFILGSDLGILIGVLMDNPNSFSGKLIIAILQGLAGGTLLYIALCEIIPREKGRKLPHWAYFIQYISLLLGFGLMSIIIHYL